MEILDPTPRMSFLFLVVARGRREREIENSVLSTILPKESTLGPGAFTSPFLYNWKRYLSEQPDPRNALLLTTFAIRLRLEEGG